MRLLWAVRGHYSEAHGLRAVGQTQTTWYPGLVVLTKAASPRTVCEQSGTFEGVSVSASVRSLSGVQRPYPGGRQSPQGPGLALSGFSPWKRELTGLTRQRGVGVWDGTGGVKTKETSVYLR